MWASSQTQVANQSLPAEDITEGFLLVVFFFFSFLKATNVKTETDPPEARTHNLRRRMGCAPPKTDSGEWKHSVNAAFVTLHERVLKSAVGTIQSILWKTPTFCQF